MTATITFLGAAGTVTGSCYLVQQGDRRLLIDCGLFQGPKTLKELNYRDFSFDAGGIGAVLLTHAHIDHSGLLPKLVNAGFAGRVFATAATRDLLTYMLPDCGYIQEAEVEQLNRRLVRRGAAPVKPIYTKLDAERSLGVIDPVALRDWFEPLPGMRARFWPAGHILGAASIELALTGGEQPVRLLFSGDLGPSIAGLHSQRDAPQAVDYLVVEATYGNRRREAVDSETRRLRLADQIQAALDRGGNLIIPVFAVERTQELLADLGRLIRDGVLRRTPVFLDSPLAVHATEVFRRHADEFAVTGGHGDPLDCPDFHFVGTVEESKKLNKITSGAIILAASGMCEAGRIRHHLTANLWRAECTVLMVGYQAPGTLGRLLLDGQRSVRIMGEEIRVRAAIRDIDVYSAHADQRELLTWIAAREPVTRAILLTHGEPEATAGLAAMLAADPHPGRATVLRPSMGDVLSVEPGRSAQLSPGVRRSLPPAVEADWHNLYSGFLLDLAGILRQAPDDQVRHDLLQRLQQLLRHK